MIAVEASMLKKILTTTILLSAIGILIGCDDSTTSSGTDTSGEWLLPQNAIFDGGPGKDGIPAVGGPQFINVDEATFLDDNDLVVGININGDIKAYPHLILDWHEIVNDNVGSKGVSLTYCPLTGSAIGWGREVDGRSTTFGVSGLLYNNNLMPYDRATNSTWSQMELKCVNGNLIGAGPEIVHVIETTWGTWKELYPNSRIMSTNTGFNKPYGQYPYGDYRTNHGRLLFPITNDDSRLPRKERVLGVIVGDRTKAYQIDAFDDELDLIQENLNGTELVVVGSSDYNFAAAFSRELPDGTLLDFRALEPNDFPEVMRSTDGTRWDIFGVGTQGLREDERLAPALSFISYWFAWGAFYPGAALSSL
ncbi:MAG: DUF3179 domain-containing protein [candidate division Zixibacteria bacterium]|nr:DUF3179 domain-containing protein [candidate division Zixibacteria bacterium]